jgi:uncharacterized membrane protein
MLHSARVLLTVVRTAATKIRTIMTDITADYGASSAPATARPALAAGLRLREIDMLRGLVIALMALDHVRDYFLSGSFMFSAVDPDRSYAALYATRWITHLCAPTFVFLAGVSAFLQAAKGKPVAQLSRFLFVRGLWLVALEMTVISFAWSFAMPYPLFLQVIWAIGCSMAALAALVWLPRGAVLVIGIAIVAGHNLLGPVTPDQFGAFSIVWKALHEGGRIMVDGAPIGSISYPVLPWIGVMALGYGLGSIFLESPEKRDRMLVMLGLAMIALFVALRWFNLYGDPRPWTPREELVRSVMAFLNVQKYPPSLMYVLATLGIAFLLIPILARLRGAAARVLLDFGAVPFFFYVAHLYVVHALSIGANAALGRDVSGLFDFFVNMIRGPDRYLHLGFSLGGVYVAWIVVLALLYPLCRWWASVKRRRREWWLSYL